MEKGEVGCCRCERDRRGPGCVLQVITGGRNGGLAVNVNLRFRRVGDTNDLSIRRRASGRAEPKGLPRA